jgi:hypothetical protein
MSAEALGVLDNVRLIRWLLGHSEKIPVLMGYLDAYKDAGTIAEKIRSGVVPTLLLLADIIETLPNAQVAEVNAGNVKAQALMAGVNWDKLQELAAFLLPIVLDTLLKHR